MGKGFWYREQPGGGRYRAENKNLIVDSDGNLTFDLGSTDHSCGRRTERYPHVPIPVRALLLALLSVAALSCQDNTLRSPGGDASSDHQAVDVTLAPIGAACSGSAACQSGFCVDGICCTTACGGGCRTCSAPDTVGTCVLLPPGGAPRQVADCPIAAPASCGLDGTCDGAGACRLYFFSECGPGVCSNGVIVGASVCDGQGTCRAGSIPTICAPFDCDPATNRCKTSCQSDGDCLGGRQCNNGACGVLNPQPCQSGCLSGFCPNGVCCDTACVGPCVSCELPGKIGSCTPVPNPPDAGACAP
jgi:hypothetical protein